MHCGSCQSFRESETDRATLVSTPLNQGTTTRAGRSTSIRPLVHAVREPSHPYSRTALGIVDAGGQDLSRRASLCALFGAPW